VVFEVANALAFPLHVLRESISDISVDLRHDHREFAGEAISVVADSVLQVWVGAYTFNRCDVPQRLALAGVFKRGVDSDLVRIGNAYVELESTGKDRTLLVHTR